MKTAEEWAVEYNERYNRLNKEAEEKVGEGVVPSEDLHEIIIRMIQADAIAEAHRIVMDDSIIYPGMELSMMRKTLLGL